MGWMLNGGGHIESPKPSAEDLRNQALEGVDKSMSDIAKQKLAENDEDAD